MSARSHFELLGLPERFAVDRSALDEAYRRVQSAIHPDRFAAADDVHKRMAMQLAAQANEAVRVLRDPARRAAYLCEQRGAAIDAQSNTAMPTGFLAAQMAWREALDEARQAANAPVQVAALADEVGRERDALLAEIGQALDDDDDAGRAAQAVRRLMFVDRFLAEVRDSAHRQTARG